MSVNIMANNHLKIIKSQLSKRYALQYFVSKDSTQHNFNVMCQQLSQTFIESIQHRDLPLETEALLNNIYVFSTYLKESTTLFHCKDQLVIAV
jgi:hypothetical protein